MCISILSDIIFYFALLYIHLITSVTSYFSCSDSTHRNLWSVNKIRTRRIYQPTDISADTHWLKIQQYEHTCCLIHREETFFALMPTITIRVSLIFIFLPCYTDYITEVCHKCLQNIWYIWKFYWGLLIKPYPNIGHVINRY